MLKAPQSLIWRLLTSALLFLQDFDAASKPTSALMPLKTERAVFPPILPFLFFTFYLVPASYT